VVVGEPRVLGRLDEAGREAARLELERELDGLGEAAGAW